MREKKERIRPRVLIPVGIALLLLVGISIVSDYVLVHRPAIQAEIEEHLAQITDFLDEELAEEAELYNGLTDFLERDEMLRISYRARDREALLRRAQPLFEELRSKYRLTHFYFIDADKTCFLRVHNPGRYGDAIDRFTLNRAASEGKPAYGIELGPFGTFTLRGVRPWKIDGELAGYIELGEEIEHMIPKVAKFMDVELFFLVRKELLDRRAWEEGLRMTEHTGDWDEFPYFVVMGHTLDRIPAEISEYLKKTFPRENAEHFFPLIKTSVGSRKYLGGFAPLMDAAGTRVGEILLLHDVTRTENALKIEVLEQVIGLGAFAAAFLALFHLYFGRVERQLSEAHGILLSEIEERHRAERAMTESRDFLQLVIDAIPGPLTVIRRDYSIALANRDAQEAAGGQDPVAKCLKCHQISHRSETPCVRAEDPCPFDLVVSSKAPVVVAHTHHDAQGREIYVEVVGAPVFDENGEVAQVIEWSRDITKRVQIGRALRESEERYRGLINNLPVGLYRNTPGPEGRFIMANPAMARMFGYGSVEEILEVPVADLYADPAARQKISEELLATGYAMAKELSLKKKDGAPIWGAVTARVVRNASGEVEYFDGLIEDVTGRKLALEALRESEERVRTILDTAQTGIVIVDPETHRIVDINAKAASMINAPKEEIVGKICHRFICRAEEGHCPITDERQEFENAERILLTADGRSIPILKTVARVTLGGKTHLLESFLDISERKKAEEERRRFEAQLLQTDKMKSLNIMAGAVAHHFNNMLMAVLGYQDLAVSDLEEGSPVRAKIREAQKAAMRAAELSSMMLVCSGQGQTSLELIAFDRLIETARTSLLEGVPAWVRVRFQLAGKPALVQGDPAQIRQLLKNLVINAVEAIGEKEGTVSVSTDVTELSREDLAAVYPDDNLPAGRYVRLEVADTGCGMDEATLARIFDPFFTTKFTGRGLGMAVCLGIVRGHDGAIKIASRPGEGTTVEVFLPVAEREEKTAGKREKTQRTM